MTDDETARTVGGLIADVNNLKGWQEVQNGTLLRLEEKVDALKESLGKAFSGWNKWVIGLLTMTVFILLAALISLKFGLPMATVSLP